MTGVLTAVVCAVAAVVGAFLACLGYAGFETGRSQQIAGPLRTSGSVVEQAVGLGLFVAGLALVRIALAVAGWWP